MYSIHVAEILKAYGGKIMNANTIQLANDIMEDFRANGKEIYSYGTYFKSSNRIGSLETELTFKQAMKVIKDSLELLKTEYKISYENMGMYYTIKKRITNTQGETV